MSQPSLQTDERRCNLASTLANTSEAMRTAHEIVQDLELQVLQRLQGEQQNLTAPLNVQSIDLLSQSLKEIELLLARIAAAIPQTTMIKYDDVIGPIRLEHLRLAVSDEPHLQHRSTDARAGDDIALFCDEPGHRKDSPTQ